MENRDREADMKKLADAFFAHLGRDDGGYGGWGLDDKRPFGNRDVEGDIVRIVGFANMENYDAKREYAASLYNDLGEWLQKFWKKAHPENEVIETCLGCGGDINERDCSCPAGTGVSFRDGPLAQRMKGYVDGIKADLLESDPFSS